MINQTNLLTTKLGPQRRDWGNGSTSSSLDYLLYPEIEMDAINNYRYALAVNSLRSEQSYMSRCGVCMAFHY